MGTSKADGGTGQVVTKKPPQETAITRSILNWLNAQPFTLARKLHGTGFGHSGDPDIYGSWLGQFFTIEVKQPGKKPRPIQVTALKRWARTGAIVIVAHSLDEIRQSFAKFHEYSSMQVLKAEMTKLKEGKLGPFDDDTGIATLEHS